jgi:lipid-A-disaccharide synthase
MSLEVGMKEALRLAIVAGEHSGDAHGGNLVGAFIQLAPDARWFGAGGPVLSSSGVEILVPMEKLAVVGISEVLTHLPDLWREMSRLKTALAQRRPDALVLVDFPDFNFRLAKFARGLGIPVVYYITPQVWAWRPGRTEFLRRFVDRALVIFPFEESFLRERGVEAVFVGHPVVDTAHPDSPLEAFLARHGLDASVPRVALLPGSRVSEVRRNLPPLVAAAVLLHARHPEAAIMVPWAEGLPDTLRAGFPAAPVRWISGAYRDVLGHAHAAAVASGTATLEAALMSVPQVIVYRLKPLTYAIGRRLVKLERVGLPNVVLGESVVLELIQDDFTPARVAAALGDLLENETAATARAGVIAARIKAALGRGNASARAASELLSYLEGMRTNPKNVRG